MIFMRFPGGKSHALTLSYDDGVEQDARLIEIMNRYGLKGTFNLNSGLFAAEGTVYPDGQIQRRLSLKAARALYAGSGLEVGFHGVNHGFMEDLPPNRQAWELMEDRAALEVEFGGMVRGGAYPYGTHNDGLVKTLEASGAAYCRTVISSGGFDTPEDWLRLKPTCHHADPRLMELTERFLNEPVERKPYLFYLWGHSYEFERDDNWQAIEDFAAMAGNRDGVYYATNIELCDYVRAFKGLRFSCDGRRVENPWAMPLWFAAGNKTYQLRAGERITLAEA